MKIPLLVKICFLLTLLLTSIFTPVYAQTANLNGSVFTGSPNLVVTPFTLTSVCTTPATPALCPSNSYKLIPLSGVGELSIQTPNLRGGTIAWYTGNDGSNFVPVNMSVGSTLGTITTAQSSSIPGKFTFSGSGASYLEVVMISPPSAGGVLVTPNLSQHTSTVSIHSSVPLTVRGGTTTYTITSASPTACTNIVNTATRIYSITNSGPATTIFPVFYQDNGTSCAANAAIIGDGSSLILQAGQVVSFPGGTPLTGLAYKLSGALSAQQNLIIVTGSP